jgi:hypothetical protein
MNRTTLGSLSAAGGRSGGVSLAVASRLPGDLRLPTHWNMTVGRRLLRQVDGPAHAGRP